MTDGVPSANVTGGDCTDPTKEIKWRGLLGTNTAPYNCALFFAREAAEKNVTVYTIGIGPGADKYLLQAMAEGKVPLDNPYQPCDPDTNNNGHPCGDDGYYFPSRGGKYFPAPRPSDLDGILDQILEDVYVRIVG